MFKRILRKHKEKLQNRFWTICVQGGSIITFLKLLNNRYVIANLGNNRALLSCIIRNNVEFARILLSRKDVMDSLIPDQCIRTAIGNGSIDIIKELLVYDSIHTNFNPINQIIYCANERQVEIAKVILDNWVNIKKIMNFYRKFSYNLISSCNQIRDKFSELALSEIIEYMIYLGFNFSDNRDYALQTFVEYGFISTIKILLEQSDVNPTFGNNIIIQDACIYNNLELVDILLKDNRVDPTYNNNKVLNVACSRGYLSIVKRLFDDDRVKKEFKVSGNITFLGICNSLNYNIIKYFVDNKDFDPSFNNNLLLRRSFEYCNKNVIKYLIQDTRVMKILTKKEKKKLEDYKLVPNYKPRKSNFSKKTKIFGDFGSTDYSF